MADQDPQIVMSPLSRKFSEAGQTVDVEIYRLADAQGWALEVIDSENTSTTWDELFATDREALEFFEGAVKEMGLAAFLQDEDDEA